MNGVSLIVVPVERVERLLSIYGDRFTMRFFGQGERAYCESRRRRAQHYAARLAAKLAVRRLLPRTRLTDLEIERSASGSPSLRLRGWAEVARQAACLCLHVSLSHDAGLAVALVVGEREET
ncbi:MAG: holo-ACP synthase [Myxococcales bacterium]|nr:holo-ACP synthase [Myxococcales bacterium]